MLTKEAAAERAATMTDAQVDQLADQAGYGEGDQNTLAVAALLERAHRNQARERQAQLDAPRIAAESAARLVYDGLGLPARGFQAWYEEYQRKEARERLDSQRAAARYLAARRF
jgi:hypothetical protein